MCTKVYVGNLAKDATENELEKAFNSYGPLKSVWVARNPAGFAFIEFEDSRDAEDAVHGLDGTNICGGRVRVEVSTGKSKPKPWLRGGGGERSRGPPRGRRPFHPEDRCYECGGRGHYAYDCPQHRGGGRRDRSRRSSRYSRSRSRSPRRRSYSRSRSRSRSPVRSRYRSYSRSKSHSKSPDKRRSYNDNGRDSEDR